MAGNQRRQPRFRLRLGCTALAVAASVGVVTGFRQSTDGRLHGRIVFAAASSPAAGGDLYVVDANGAHLRALTHDATMQQSPTWAPNGKTIAYVNASDGMRGAIYEIGADGSRPRPLLRESPSALGMIGDPTWSPDGRRLAFDSARDGTYQVWSYTRNGVLNELTHEPVGAGHASWSPDGKQLAYSGSAERERQSIFVIGGDGSNRHDVSHAPYADEGPVWSPNGKWIAFRALNPGWEQHESDSLVLVNPGGTVRRTLVTGGSILPASWSPSSDAILFLWISDPEHPTTSRRQLYTVSLSGGTPKPLAGTYGAIGGASWHR